MTKSDGLLLVRLSMVCLLASTTGRIQLQFAQSIRAAMQPMDKPAVLLPPAVLDSCGAPSVDRGLLPTSLAAALSSVKACR